MVQGAYAWLYIFPVLESNFITDIGYVKSSFHIFRNIKEKIICGIYLRLSKSGIPPFHGACHCCTKGKHSVIHRYSYYSRKLTDKLFLIYLLFHGNVHEILCLKVEQFEEFQEIVNGIHQAPSAHCGYHKLTLRMNQVSF